MLSPELPSIFPEVRYHDRGNLYSLRLFLLLHSRAQIGCVEALTKGVDWRTQSKSQKGVCQDKRKIKQTNRLVQASQRQLRPDVFGLAACQTAAGCRMRIWENE